MKRNVLFAGASAVVFALFFALTWMILRVLAQDFQGLAPLVGRLSAAASLILTGYVFFDALKEEEQSESAAARSPSREAAVHVEGV